MIDERLVTDGFLDAYRVQIWPTGNMVEAATLRKVKAWIEKGCTLMVLDANGIRTVEGAAAFRGFSPGKGQVIEIGKDAKDLEP